ncbi:septum formation family protein, partial [Actinomyces sp. MRS3W]|uniref:septum formation family protein n=1 Tax=Actinomyces sp. MRS3W TaxID=2800796 RepID=UPI0028FD8237
ATPTADVVSSMDIQVGDCLVDLADPTPATAPATTATGSTTPSAPSATGSATATGGAADTVTNVSRVDCASPHLYEVYAEGAISADTFPDDELMEQYVSDICYGAFETYVGMSYDDAYAQGSYAASSLRPTEATWAQGDRTVSCLLTSVDGSQLTGSARGAND